MAEGESESWSRDLISSSYQFGSDTLFFDPGRVPDEMRSLLYEVRETNLAGLIQFVYSFVEFEDGVRPKTERPVLSPVEQVITASLIKQLVGGKKRGLLQKDFVEQIRAEGMREIEARDIARRVRKVNVALSEYNKIKKENFVVRFTKHGPSGRYKLFNDPHTEESISSNEV